MNSGGRGQGAQGPGSFPFSSVANMFRQEEIDGSIQVSCKQARGTDINKKQKSIFQLQNTFHIHIYIVLYWIRWKANVKCKMR